MTGVKELENGDYVSYNGKPCRVKSKVNVTVGTHCHTKVKLELEFIFEKRTEEIAFATHTQLEQLEIYRKKGQIIAKQGETLQVMDLVSYETFDAGCEKELYDELEVGNEVIFLDISGKIWVADKRKD